MPTSRGHRGLVEDIEPLARMRFVVRLIAPFSSTSGEQRDNGLVSKVGRHGEFSIQVEQVSPQLPRNKFHEG
jgi:hypothetical protein